MNRKLNMKTTLTGKDRTAIPTEYVFGNAGDRAKTQFLELSRLYDAQTIRQIEQRGIDEGWSCLEVGGGGGSIRTSEQRLPPPFGRQDLRAHDW